MSSAHDGGCTALLQDGRILVVGGSDANGPTANADIFNTDGTWSSAAAMHSSRAGQACAVLQNGQVLAAGGNTSAGATNTAELYDPSANSWLSLPVMTQARSGASASLLQDGRVLLAGGGSDVLEIFDPNSQAFSFDGTMSATRSDAAAAVLQDGRVLIAGGTGVDASGNPVALASSDIYDPASGVYAGPALAVARSKHSATTQLDGKVAVIGGSSGSADLNSIEIFDPATGNFSSASASLGTTRSGHLAFLLPKNNEILVVGGQSAGIDLASAELYAPWGGVSGTSAMKAARSQASGSSLSIVDGLLLVAGGSKQTSADLYGFATVKTDKDDYAPGTTVTITGTGWQPGEVVALTFVESLLIDTHPTLYATANANGNISNSQFSPDSHDINVRFYLTATGSQSQAQNMFTDSQPTSVTLNPASVTVAPSGSAVYTTAVVMGGNSNNSCTVTLSVSPSPVTTGATPSFSGGVNPVTTNVDFSRTLTIATTNSTVPGSYSFTVTAAKGTDCQGGAVPTISGTLVVSKVTPVVTWSNPTDIVYGTPLSNTQLNATASVPGTFVYTPPAGTVLLAGLAQTLSVTFTPTDQITYNSVVQTAKINVTQVSTSTALQSWTLLAASGTGPAQGLFGMSVVEDGSGNLIMFGGKSGSTLYNDVWVVSGGNGLRGTPTWSKLSPAGGPPVARFNHMAVYDSVTNSMIIYGGCGGGCFPIENDAWVLSHANGIGGTPTWSSLNSSGPSSGGRQNMAKAYDPISNRAIIFGGQNGGGSGGATFQEVWVLTNANGTGGSAVWSLLTTSGAMAPGQYGPSSFYDVTNNRLTVAGGAANGTGVATNAVYALTHANGLGGTPTWTNLVAEGAAGSPAAFSGYPAAYDAVNNRGILVESGTNNIWVLSNANGTGGSTTYSHVTPSGGVSAGAGLEGAAYDPASNRVSSFYQNAGSNQLFVLGSADALGLPNPSTFQQSVTFTATVSPVLGTGSPTGTVTFKDGATTLGTGTLSTTSGVTTATFTTGVLSVGAHTITAVYGTDGNFTASTSWVLTQTVTKATATVTLGSLSQTYSGSPETATATTNPSGLTVNFTYNGSSTAPTNVGSYTVVGTISDSNYQGSATGTLVISKATPTITWANPADISYGTALSLTQLNALASVPGTFVYSPASGTTLSAGSGQTLSANFTPTDTTDYNLPATNLVLINVNKLTLTITGVVANNKPYNQTTAATLNNVSAALSGAVNGDSSNLTLTPVANGTFASATVGTSIAVTPVGLYSISGSAASNYTLTQPSGLTANITALSTTCSITANNKTYDGSTTATVSNYTVSSVLSGDTVNCSSGMGGTTTFADRNAGNGKTVTATALTLGGKDAGNYVLSSTTATATANITPLAITVTAATNSKQYDGTITAAATPTITSGALQGTDTANFTETYDTKNVGTGKTLTPSGTVADGNSGNNYTYTFTNATGAITARAVTVTAVSNTKQYDGTTASAGIPTFAPALVTGDTPNFTEAYIGKNVGTGLTLIPSGSVSDGNGGSNYAVTFANNTTGVITALTVAPHIAANNKPYDGNTTATLSSQTVAGVITPDAVTLTVGAANFDTKNVGTGKTVIGTGLTLAGVDAGNYTLLNGVTTATAAADITTRAITVTADAKSKVYGSPDPAFTNSITSGSLVAGDSLSGSVNRATGENVGTYAIQQGTLTAGSNYALTYVGANLTITTASLTITASDGTMTYGGTVPTITPSYGGFVNGDTASSLTPPPSCTTTATSSSPVGSYPATCSGAVDANYIINYVPSTVTVTKASQAITFGSISNHTYGDLPFAISATASSGLTVSFGASGNCAVSGNTVTITGAGSCTITASQPGNGNYLAALPVAESFSIDKVTASVTPNASGKVYGQLDPALSGTLSGFLPSDGITAVYNRTLGENAGVYPISATLSPVGVLGNYNIAYNTAIFTITQATPIVTWATPADITYGTALSATQLNATASVIGAFAYTPATGTVLLAGSGQPLSVTFTPADALDYTINAATVNINVLKAVPTIIWDNPADITYGTVLSGTQLNAIALPNYALSGWWKAENDATDSIAGNDGTVLGGTTYEPGQVGQAFSFPDASGDGVTVPHNAGYDMNAPGFTASFRMKGTQNQNGQSLVTLLEKSQGFVDATGWALQARLSDGAMQFTVGNGTVFPEIWSNVNVLDGTWHLVTGTWDGTSATLFVDGTSMGSVAVATPANNTRGVNVGFAWGGGTSQRFFQGAIDEVQIFAQAIPAGAFTYTPDSGTTLGAGTGQTLSATFAPTDTTNLNPPAKATVKINVNKADAHITVTPYGVTYDGNSHTATGTATGVGGVDLSADLDLSGTTHTSAGTYAGDKWSFHDGSGNYADASGTVDDSIAKANAKITVTPYSVTYDGAAHTAAGAATGVNGESLTGLDLSGTTHTDAGTYTDSWTFTDVSGNYNNATGTVSDSIAKADAKITVTPYSVTYDGSPHTATGTVTGVKGETLAGLDLSGTTHTNAADYPNDPWAFTDSTGNYNNANATVHDSIAKANANITITPYSVIYDGNPHTATGVATGVEGTPADLSSLLHLDKTTHTNAGDYPADGWIFDGNVNYNPTKGTVHDCIKPRLITMTADAKSKVYGDTDPALTYQITSGSLVTTDSFSGNLTRAAGENVGTYAIQQGTLALSANYTITYVEANLTIAARPITVTADAQTKVYGDTDPALTYKITSGSLVTGDSFAGGLIRVKGEDAGTYAIQQGTLLLSTNYNLSFVGATLTITQADATIVVKGYGGIYDGNAHGASGTATGVKGEDLSTLLNLGATFTDVPGGTANWTFAGNTNYKSAHGSVSITITQADAKITVNGYTGVYDGNTHGATGTAAGAKNDDLSALLNLGGVFTDAPGGTAHWSFAGNTNYKPASGDASIVIMQADAKTIVSGYTGIYDGHAHGATGTATGVNGEDLISLLNLGATFTDVPGGIANWSFAGNLNYKSASGAAAITITKATAAITVTPYSVTYDGNAHTAAGSATGVGGVDLSATLTLSGTIHTSAGDYAADAWSFSGGTNYNDAKGTVPDCIKKASATISVAPYSVTYDGNAHTATGSALGVNSETLSGLGLSHTTNTNAGTYSDYWTFTDSTGNYNNVGNTTITDSIKKADAVISVSGYSGVYDANSHGATGSAKGVKGEDLSALLNLGGSFTDVPGGTARWTFAEDPNYSAAAGDVNIAITQAQASVTVNGYTGVYDGNAHGATGSATGLKGENLNSLLSLGASFTDVSGGTANWSFAGNTDYKAALGSVSITITKAPSYTTVSVAGGESFTYDSLSHPATVSVTGVNLSLTPAPVYSCGHAPINYAESSCTASYTYAGDANHSTSMGIKTYAITQAPLTVTAKDASTILDASLPTFTGTVAVVKGSDGITATYSTAATGTAVGTFPITPALADPNGKLPNYTVTKVPGTLTVGYALAGGLCDGDAGHQILQPVNADGTSTFKQGSTVPAKFRVCDAKGTSIGTPGVVSGFYLIKVVNGTVLQTVDEAIVSTTPDMAFRWDSTNQLWIFNISTGNLPKTNTYYYQIALNDGSSIKFQYGLPK